MKRDEKYHELKWRVKIMHFTEQGFDINGIVHVGANDGYEIQFYLGMGIDNIIAVEPLSSAVDIMKEKFKKEISENKVMILDCGLGENNENKELFIAPGDGKGSTFLEEIKPSFTRNNKVFCNIFRFDYLASLKKIDLKKYDYLVVDVQGMELEVLKGFGETIKNFKMMHIECSEKPFYFGEASGKEISIYLDSMGFRQDSPIEIHDDVFFINKELK